MEEKQKSHDRLLAECFQYLWNNYSLTRRTMFHVTNESKPASFEWLKGLLIAFCKRFGFFVNITELDLFVKHSLNDKHRVIELSKLKAIGVVAGVLDLVWFWRGKFYAFDIKVGKDKLSKPQQDFIAAIEEQGGSCFEITNFMQFKSIVDKILM